MAHDYSVHLGIPKTRNEITLHMYSDIEKLSSAYARATNRSVESARKSVERNVAIARDDQIFMNASHPWYANTEPKYRVKVIAHELMHMYQNDLSELEFLSEDHVAPEGGPRWLREGIAEYLAYKALSDGGILSYESKRNSSFVSAANRTDKPLSEMEAQAGIRGVDYSYHLLAVELLVKFSTEESLLKFYELQHKNTTWQEAFETAFGMPVEEFYDLFEEHRAAGFPDPNASKPKPEATGPYTVGDYIVWKVGDEVSREAETEVRGTVQAVHDYAASHGLPRIGRPITIFLFHNLDSLASEFETATGRKFEEWFWTGFKEGESGTLSSKDFIAVNTSASRYQEISPDERARRLARSLFDVYRRTLSGIWEGTPRDAVSREGPEWLRGGSSRFLTWQATRGPGPESCDPTRNRFANLKGLREVPLTELETSAGYYKPGHPPHQYGFLATELLAEQAGIGSIFAYYASLSTGTSWQQAFETAFGITVDEFYQLFEERRAAGFTRPRCETLPPLVALPGSPEYVKWEIGAGVRSEYVGDSVEGVRLMHEYAESLGAPEIGREFSAHLYYDQEELIANYEITSGNEAGWVARESNAVAGDSYFFTNVLRWEERETSSNSRKKISAHELFHVFQGEWASGYRGPAWITEGTAEYLAFRALDAGGVLSYDTQRNSPTSSKLVAGLVRSAKDVVKPLSELETYQGFQDVAAKGSAYPFTLLAAELLAHHAGEKALISYFTLLKSDTTWQQAFHAAFGMTVEEFYELFEEHRAAGFPDPNGAK